MLSFRLYILVLNVVFLALSVTSGKLGLLAGTAITCATLFLIFDARADLDELKLLEFQVRSISQAS